MRSRRSYVRVVLDLLLFVAVVALTIYTTSVKHEIVQNRKKNIELQNERITYQNGERELDCRLFAMHGRDDPLCHVPPETTIAPK